MAGLAPVFESPSIKYQAIAEKNHIALGGQNSKTVLGNGPSRDSSLNPPIQDLLNSNSSAITDKNPRILAPLVASVTLDPDHFELFHLRYSKENRLPGSLSCNPGHILHVPPAFGYLSPFRLKQLQRGWTTEPFIVHRTCIQNTPILRTDLATADTGSLEAIDASCVRESPRLSFPGPHGIGERTPPNIDDNSLLPWPFPYLVRENLVDKEVPPEVALSVMDFQSLVRLDSRLEEVDILAG
jgi:hypothetical protein